MSGDYEYYESLGAHHPIQVEVTVAQAEQRERQGIPLPISGDAETDHARELLVIGRARRQEMAAAPVVETEAALDTDASVGLVAAAGLVVDVVNDEISHLDFEVRPVLGRLRDEIDAFLQVTKRSSELKRDVADELAEHGLSGGYAAKVGDLLASGLDEADHLLTKRFGDRRIRHEDSFQLGAVQAVEGLDVLKPTVRGATDKVADSFSAADVRGVQEGAAASPAAAPDSKLTPAQRRAAHAVAAVEREKELAAGREARYDRYQDSVTPGKDIRLTVGEAMDNENDGYPTPVGGDRKVTLQEAIDRGAVAVTKGLPAAVVWRRSNPSISKTMPFKVKLGNADLPWTAPGQSRPLTAFMWPAPSHQALTDSMKALAGVQRRLMIGGRLAVSQ